MKRRNCQGVITQILAKIPADKTELIADLKWNHEDAGYKAPEETLQWHNTHATLLKHIPIPIADWEFEVVSIFSMLTVEELRGRFQSIKK